MSTFTIAAGVTSRPHFVPAGSIVKVSPAAGASAVVEYTRGSLVEIANGVATWAPWPKGPVAVETSDLVNNPVSVRVTSAGGAVTLDMNTSPSAKDLASFQGDFGSPVQLAVSPVTFAPHGITAPDGKTYAKNAFDHPYPGQVVASFAGDGVANLVSAGAGEAVGIEVVGGIPMLKCTLSTTAAALFQADYTLTTPVFLGYANSIQFPIRFTDMSPSEIATSTVQAWLYTEGTSTNVRAQLSLEYQEPGLFVASFSRDSLISGATPITQLDVDRISKIRILITAGSSSVAKAPVYIGPITANRRRSKGRVLIYFDGEYDSQHKYLLPLLDRYGLKATLAITNKDIGGSGRMTMAQLAAAYANGHTICHHTFGNKTAGWDSATDYPDQASVTADLYSQWAFLAAQGWNRGIGHCVNGYTNAFTNTVDNARQNMVSAGLAAASVKTCRVGGSYIKAAGGVGQLFPAAHKNANWRRMYGGIQVTSTDTPTTVQAVIDAAEKRGELASILLHRAVLDSATPGALEMKISDCNTWVEYLADRCSRGGLINETVDVSYTNLAT